MKRNALIALSALISIVLTQGAGMPLSAQSGSKVDDHLVVHEWGTFTSIAGEKACRLNGGPSPAKATCPRLSTPQETRHPGGDFVPASRATSVVLRP